MPGLLVLLSLARLLCYFQRLLRQEFAKGWRQQLHDEEGG